ncbi:MAG: hypothetical protein HYV41_03420 [Candidatus Magasanikbacteria bacterium]|nr:hypothetical protein [Candidatus Magasanikbacteria bacterium]
MKQFILALSFLGITSGCVFSSPESENITQQEVLINNSKPESITIPESLMSPLSFDTSTQIENSTESQDVVVDLEVGISGGMGLSLLQYAQEKTILPFSAYLDQDDLDKVLANGGGLPTCYVGTPKVRMSANITLVQKTEKNYSIEPDESGESEMRTYYEAQVNEIYEVLIQAEGC